MLGSWLDWFRSSRAMLGAPSWPKTKKPEIPLRLFLAKHSQTLRCCPRNGFPGSIPAAIHSASSASPCTGDTDEPRSLRGHWPGAHHVNPAKFTPAIRGGSRRFGRGTFVEQRLSHWSEAPHCNTTHLAASLPTRESRTAMNADNESARKTQQSTRLVATRGQMLPGRKVLGEKVAAR